MIIKTKISFKEYLKLLFTLTYKKLMMRVIAFIALATLFWVLGYYFKIFLLPKPSYYQYITLVLIIIIQPLFIYYTIWKNYYSSVHLKEWLDIELTQKQIKITGESFYIELGWEKIYKVEELKTWFLIYQNNLSAIIVPKKSLHSHVKEFKQILKQIPSQSLHLKQITIDDFHL